MRRLSGLFALALLVALTLPIASAQGMQIDKRRDLRQPFDRMLPIHLGMNDGPVTMADNGHGMRLATWAYQSGLEVDVALSLRVGTTWGPVELFGQGNGLIDFAPDIAFLPDGRPVLAWTQRDPRSGDTNVVFSLLTASGWLAPEQVNPEGTNASAPHLVPSAGKLSVVYADASGQLVMRAFSTSTAMDDDPGGHSGSNGPDPMPNISIPPERDPTEFPMPQERFPYSH